MCATSAKGPHFKHRIPRPSLARGFTLIELMVVVAIIALLIAFLLPAVRTSGEAAHRSQCVNNLKQIALALHNYERDHHALPPAYTVDCQGRPLHSWRTLILPYLEQRPLYQTIDLAKPWNDPANAKALRTAVPVFRCPSAAGPANATTYLAIVAPDACFRPNEPRSLADITDKHDSTLMVIEASDDHAVPWMAPVDADAGVVTGFNETTKLHHPGGANAGLVDGSVRFLKARIPADVRRALISIAGNEEVSADSW